MDLQNSMTSGYTNFLIALTSLVTAVGIVIVNVMIARAKIKVEATAALVIEKAEEIGETTKTTLGHVNSAATEMRAAIDALQKENALLRATASDNREIAAVLAAAHAAHATTDGPTKVQVVNPPSAPVPTEVVNTPAAPVPVKADAPKKES